MPPPTRSLIMMLALLIFIGPAATALAQDNQETYDDISEEMADIRGLDLLDPIDVEVKTRQELQDETREDLEVDYPQAERDDDQLVLEAFGLIDPDQELGELYVDLLGEQIAGYYDPETDEMVVVASSDANELSAADQITFAHEVVHALQDQHYDLESYDDIRLDGTSDQSLAVTALIEGDATVTMLSWMLQHLGQDEILEYFSSAEVPDTTGIPSWMVAQLAFPYEAGLNWTTALAGGDPTNPDFIQIDAAYDDPPGSTEQIIDLDKWESREAPVDLAVPDLAAVLGDGWEEVDATPIGQASINIMLEYFGVVAADADEASVGWGGDRAVIATGPDDAFAVAWLLAWDSTDDAAEFLAAYESVVDSLDFPASVTELPSGEILVAHASSEDLLVQTVDAAD